jgi:hypothetical protein
MLVEDNPTQRQDVLARWHRLRAVRDRDAAARLACICGYPANWFSANFLGGRHRVILPASLRDRSPTGPLNAPENPFSAYTRFSVLDVSAGNQALLDDHVGVALERVDDRGVLLDVVHRQARDGHPAALLVSQRPPGCLHLV